MCRWGRTISFKTLISLAHAKLGGESWAVIQILTHSNRSGELRDTSAAPSGRIDFCGSSAAWRAAPQASFRLCWEPSTHTDCCRVLCCCLKPMGSQSGGIRHAVLHQCPKAARAAPCSTRRVMRVGEKQQTHEERPARRSPSRPAAPPGLGPGTHAAGLLLGAPPCHRQHCDVQTWVSAVAFSLYFLSSSPFSLFSPSPPCLSLQTAVAHERWLEPAP